MELKQAARPVSSNQRRQHRSLSTTPSDATIDEVARLIGIAKKPILYGRVSLFINPSQFLLDATVRGVRTAALRPWNGGSASAFNSHLNPRSFSFFFFFG
jgi:hypothetical protein